MIDNIIKFFFGLLQGLWNNFGILGRLFAIVLSPLAFAVLLTLYVFKFSFVLLRIMVDEVNFYIRKWIKATKKTKELLDELLIHKIIPTLKWLFNNLLDDTSNWEGSTLSSNWLRSLIYSFLGQFYLLVGISLLLISTSSFIYFIYTIGKERNYTLAWALRMALLFPIIHRYLRYKFENKPFSWKTESNVSDSQPFNRAKFLLLLIVPLILFLVIGIYCTFFNEALIFSIVRNHTGFESFLKWSSITGSVLIGVLALLIWNDDMQKGYNSPPLWVMIGLTIIACIILKFLLLWLGYGWMYLIYYILV